MTRSDLALAALASAAVPGMKPVSVAGIRPGDSDRELEIQRAVVNDATGRVWVVHAPLTPVAGARLQRHDELVRQLPRHVPFKVPAAVGYAAVGRDGSAAVYPYIEGSPLDLGRLPAGQGLASAVGRAVAAIHNIPRGVFEAQDVPVLDAAGVRQRAISEVDRAAETGRVPTGLLARWEEAFESAPLWQFATTPVHGSFGGNSLLVAFSDDRDAGSGRVVAVLNWDEACVGDPASDLAELYVQASPQAWESVLDSYSLARAQRPDPYLHARARLASELRSLRGLARGVEDGSEESVRRIVEALRRMDRLTEDDDSLVPATARHRGGAGPVAAVGDLRGEEPDDATTADGPEFDDEEWEELPAGVADPEDGSWGDTQQAPRDADRDDADDLDDPDSHDQPADGLSAGVPHAGVVDSSTSTDHDVEADDLTIEVPQVGPVTPEPQDDGDGVAGAQGDDDLADHEDAHSDGVVAMDEMTDGDGADGGSAPDGDSADGDGAEYEGEGIETVGSLDPSEAVGTPDLETERIAVPEEVAEPAEAEVVDDPSTDLDRADHDGPDDRPDNGADEDEGEGEPVDELAEMPEEERLHELYGMPEPEEPENRH